jgi:hypothetical protein
LTRATVGDQTKIAGDVCLDDEKHAMGTMKPPLMPVPAASGACYLRASTSRLPSRARTATLMPRIGAHLENVG